MRKQQESEGFQFSKERLAQNIGHKRYDRFLHSVQADFLTQSKQTLLYQKVNTLSLPHPYAQFSKAQLIEGLVTFRFNYTPYYLKKDFYRQVVETLETLPAFLLQIMYYRGLTLVIDAVSIDCGVFQIENKSITLSERYVMDELIIYTEKNYFTPEGLLGVLIHEIGHFLDWNLTRGDKLSSRQEFIDAWQADLKELPARYDISFEETREICKRYGGYVYLPSEEKRIVDFQGFTHIEQEVFAESFLYLMLDVANKEVIEHFPRARTAACQILMAEFGRIAANPDLYWEPEENRLYLYHSPVHSESIEVWEEEEEEEAPTEFGFVLADSVADTAEENIGGKAAALAKLGQLGFPVPRWFVLLPSAFYESVSDAQWNAMHTCTDFESLNAVIQTISPSETIINQVELYLQSLCANGERVAVRSSAAEEDGAEHSFAGMLESYLFVDPSEVIEKITAIWRSGFSERVFQYRQEHGLESFPPPPAVVIQHMVAADVSGVAFTADPVSGDENVTVVSAVLGLGSALVSGEVNGDTIYLDANHNVTQYEIGYQHQADYFDGEEESGMSRVLLEAENAGTEKLTARQAQVISAVAGQLAAQLGSPQDVEWAIENGELFLLQSRPITTLKKKT